MDAVAAPRAVVIIGAGLAGYSVAKTLRDRKFAGEITLIGDEAHPPYERPPLSKDVMRGDMPHEKTYLTTAAALDEKAVHFRPGTRAETIDRGAMHVVLSDGCALPYDRLVLATGGRGRAVELPGIEGAQPRYLRTIEDARAIRQTLSPDRRLLVIGGGWIGLETAATARAAGMQVTLVEAGTQLCGRALPRQAGDFLLRLHQSRGVDVRLGCVVERIRDGVAMLSSGEQINFHALVVGVGMSANTELAAAAGLAVDDGILVDQLNRTSDPSIFAAGDVARYPSETYGRTLRLESWSNAQQQGSAVASAIMGEAQPYDPVPWFWSDQYDINLQVVGLPHGDQEIVVRGDATSCSYSLFYLQSARIAAAIAINQPREGRVARRLIESRKAVDRSVLADAGVDLQRLLRA